MSEPFTISQRGKAGKKNVVKDLPKCKAITLVQKNGLWYVCTISINNGSVTDAVWSEGDDRRLAIFEFRNQAGKLFMGPYESIEDQRKPDQIDLPAT